MKKQIDITVLPRDISDENFLRNSVAGKLRINVDEITAIQILRRSIDARKNPVYRLRVKVYINEEPREYFRKKEYRVVENNRRIIIVGSGPAGLFAALKLIELGIKPVMLERGKDVRSRRFDLKSLLQDHIVNPDSNYCFGEGGAGTYSDGKLYTRSLKKGNVHEILGVFVQHGASPDILFDSHPHIGSNRLPKIVSAMRGTILRSGGEIHFESKVTDLIIKDKKVLGVIVNENKEFIGDAVILATGHSARGIYYMLNSKKIKLEAKPFAVGVRIEHPQKLIDSIQYNSKTRPENLPAASYNLSCQVDNRGVYSFCMCPGGIIVPASTSPGELVLNGMSVSRRDSPFANSGLVVSVTEEDWHEFADYGVFAGLELQKKIERSAYEYGGENQIAPAQRITDFVNGKISLSLPKSSYIPGTVSAPLHEILPEFLAERLRRSIRIFGNRMRGYYTHEAQILAAETRTSSPIRISRDKETLMHVDIAGLFPAGEGAGYAGGIVSAAIDGQRCAEKVSEFCR